MKMREIKIKSKSVNKCAGLGLKSNVVHNGVTEKAPKGPLRWRALPGPRAGALPQDRVLLPALGTGLLPQGHRLTQLGKDLEITDPNL